MILVRIETSPEDLAGMNSAEGILTARGGMTSHAAVVARGMGKCCVSGAGGVKIDYKARTIEMEGKVYKEGEFISLNGSMTEKEAEAYADDIAITPLGIPMIAGPGAITNAIVLMGEATDYTSKALVIFSIVLVLVVVLLVFMGAVGITRFIGDKGNKIMMKLMGLIVMVIAVEFFFSGLKPYIQSIIN